jgi:aryl-phospho-beta-D-glucosidase BglC (GH1 family)
MNGVDMVKVAAIAAFAIPIFGIGNGADSASSVAFLGRGVTVNEMFSEGDVADFAATGGNLMRISFALRPLRDMDPPYAINEANMALLDHDLDLCEKYHLRVVVDPHRFPGMMEKFTTHADDPIWSDASDQDLAVDLWSKIARREVHRGDVIAGYDLLNEPSLPNMGKRGTLADWNVFAAKMTAAIRAVDTKHTIILESPVLIRGDRPGAIVVNRAQAFASYLAPPSDPNTVYSLHMYDPYEITFQGLNARYSAAADYPGSVNGQRWDATTIAREFAPVAAYQKRYGVQIFLGEFGATRWSGDAGNRYIKDVIDYCEAHQWSWAYTHWRGSDTWDAEKSNSDRNDHTRYPSTPRMELLKPYWKRGAQPD